MLVMVLGNCELILCLYLEEGREAAENAVGFTESSGFLSNLGLIFGGTRWRSLIEALHYKQEVRGFDSR